ncbi:hypothetical protein Zmor_016395 [Zophobas morio]|uniref:Uncharacterized protein n=1 Tax=Zophobas morio TaxID=2755281 RepID=A0AA38HI75_9CUCU|nr:hypothetical protein Zmor_016395 [Zophobas morio]
MSFSPSVVRGASLASPQFRYLAGETHVWCTPQSSAPHLIWFIEVQQGAGTIALANGKTLGSSLIQFKDVRQSSILSVFLSFGCRYVPSTSGKGRFLLSRVFRSFVCSRRGAMLCVRRSASTSGNIEFTLYFS